MKKGTRMEVFEGEEGDCQERKETRLWGKKVRSKKT